MAIFWNPSRANILQQIRLINHLLLIADRKAAGNPIPPVAAIFLDHWSREKLEARREELVKLYRMPQAERLQFQHA